MRLRHLLFISLTFTSVFAWWLSGYNFNYRGGDVALAFLITASLVLWLSFMPIDRLDKKIGGGK